MTHPQRLRRRDHRGHLTRLTAQERLETLRQDARAQEVSAADVLDRRLSEAMMAKGEKAVAMRTVMARLPERHPVERVDEGWHPSVDRQTRQDLARGRFLEQGETSVCWGPPGTGNTHGAMGLGLKAVQQGHRTLCTSALWRLATWTKASADPRVEDRLQRSTVPKRLMIDEMGSIPIDRPGAHRWCQRISRRYARGAIILTATQRVGQWAEVFGDSIVATARLDRLRHPRHVIKMKGDADRLRAQPPAGLLNTAPAPDAGYPWRWVMFPSSQGALFQ
jgi:DNA replication protein DnaC